MKQNMVILIAVALIVIIGAIYLVTSVNATPVVATGDNVSVYYTGTLTNGTVFDSNVGKQPLQFTVGAGQLITGFDQGVIGMKLNQTKTITIPANQAYGPINPQMIVAVPLTQFGNNTVHVGNLITEVSNGQQYRGVITAMNATTAVVNFNSPLAGQTLIFKITIVSIQKKK